MVWSVPEPLRSAPQTNKWSALKFGEKAGSEEDDELGGPGWQNGSCVLSFFVSVIIASFAIISIV